MTASEGVGQSGGAIRLTGLALAALAGLTSPGAAAEGIYLTWNDCPLGAAASSDFTRACGSNDGGQSLFCSFTLSESVDSVVAVEIAVDLQHSRAGLPPWWQLAPEGCREGSLQPRAVFSASSCVDFWQGEAGGPSQEYLVGQPGGQPNQARIRIGFALPSARHRSLEAGDMYYAAELVLLNAGTSGCEGCSEPTCLVLNSILIGRLPLSPDSRLVLGAPGPGNANRVTWQGGAGADCEAVPVRARTWGQLKSLYR